LKRENMETLWQDLRFGVRILAKKPAFTAVAVLALALGIGANTAIFSVVNTILLTPLPYKEPDRLMMIWENQIIRGVERDTPSPANYIDWRDQNQSFENMAAFTGQSFNLVGVGDPERLEGQRVSSTLFPILGVEAIAGRVFLPEEDEPGNNNVALISQSLWQRRFNSDPGLIGRPLTLNGQSITVVGVIGTKHQFPHRETDVWVPIAFDSGEAARRGSHYLQVVGRLKPGVNRQQAHTDLNTIASRLEEQFPHTNSGTAVTVLPLHEQLVGDIRPALLILLGAVGFVLLIACANVANLLLAQAASRQKEISIRTALGASRFRVVRQLLTESIVLSAVGGAAGLLLAFWSIDLLSPLIPQNLSQVQGVSLDSRVLIFTLVILLMTGIIFGLAPALQASNPNLNETLKEGGRGTSGGLRQNRIRSLLVISEVALALVLLVGAGLMIRSFARLGGVNPGFQPENLLTMRVVLPDNKYATLEQRAAFYDQMIERVESLPGVESASVISWLPLRMIGGSNSFTIEGRPEPEPGQGPIASFRTISPNYFRTMGIPVMDGRALSERDTAGSTNVTVINQTMARRFWPDENPIGKRIKLGGARSQAPWLEIVGIVGDVKQAGLDLDTRPEMYRTYAQPSFFAPRDLVVRTTSNPLGLAGAVRSEIWAIDKDQPVSSVQTMENILADSIARSRFNMLLLGIFAGVAMVLSAVGIYGVMSYSVAQRTHEIGIRMALGAKPSHVLKLVVRQGMTLAAIGVAGGIVAALALTRLMTSLLFGVSATDPLTFTAISLTLVLVALAASYIPARRAAKVDPCEALRYE
jgi:predicted permease